MGLIFPLAQDLKAGGPAPQKALETFLGIIRSMEFPVKDPSAHERLVREADAFLDLEAMGKTALKEHWEKATPEEREAFMSLLWKLIKQVAYPNSHQFLGSYKIIYPEVRQVGDAFEVRSVVKHSEEALDAKVVYHLYQQNGQWRVDDIILDGISITEDMGYQFNKIISESSFSGLLKRMQEKLDQAQQEPDSKKA